MDWNVLAIVASILTIVSFIVNIYQYIRLKSVHQALDCLHRNIQAAIAESTKLEEELSSPEEKARIRVLNGMLVGLMNTCQTFLNITWKQMDKKSFVRL
jgi:hypothetical protein